MPHKPGHMNQQLLDSLVSIDYQTAPMEVQEMGVSNLPGMLGRLIAYKPVSEGLKSVPGLAYSAAKSGSKETLKKIAKFGGIPYAYGKTRGTPAVKETESIEGYGPIKDMAANAILGSLFGYQQIASDLGKALSLLTPSDLTGQKKSTIEPKMVTRKKSKSVEPPVMQKEKLKKSNKKINMPGVKNRVDSLLNNPVLNSEAFKNLERIDDGSIKEYLKDNFYELDEIIGR